MVKIDIIDKWVEKLDRLVPPEIKEKDSFLKDQIRQLFIRFTEELNLVSREEFDIQSKVLQRTREKLEALEKNLIAAYEKD